MQGCSRRFCRNLWKAYQSTCFRCQNFSWSEIASWYLLLMGKISSIGSTIRRYVFPKHRAVFGLVLPWMTHVISLFGVAKSYLPVCHEDGNSYEFTITCGLPKPWISGKIIMTIFPTIKNSIILVVIGILRRGPRTQDPRSNKARRPICIPPKNSLTPRALAIPCHLEKMKTGWAYITYSHDVWQTHSEHDRIPDCCSYVCITFVCLLTGKLIVLFCLFSLMGIKWNGVCVGMGPNPQCHSKEDNERFTTAKIKSVVIERLCFLLLFCDFDHKKVLQIVISKLIHTHITSHVFLNNRW